MKTLIMYCNSEELFPVFRLVEGDYSHLDSFCIGSDEDDKKQEESEMLVFETDFSHILNSFKDGIPLDFNPKEDKIARIAFLL